MAFSKRFAALAKMGDTVFDKATSPNTLSSLYPRKKSWADEKQDEVDDKEAAKAKPTGRERSEVDDDQ